MLMRRFGELELSDLMLGTVQFGLNYGIANISGQPSLEQVRDIIACACEGGVRCLDTAAVYGSSEEVLGKVLRGLRMADSMVVATKVCHLADGLGIPDADALVEESVARSLRRLGLEVLPICLFHTEGNFLAYSDSLLRLKEKGLVRHIGCSVNGPAGMREVMRRGTAEVVQMPSSVLDRRFTGSGISAEATERGIALFARSVYLQGLILMREDAVPDDLRQVVPVLRALAGLAGESGIGLAELAVRYMLGVREVMCLVLGVDTVDQMRENLDLFSRGPLPPDVHMAVREAVPDLPDAILFPGNWSRKMPDPQPASPGRAGGQGWNGTGPVHTENSTNSIRR